jgi:hypothetical protein
MVVLPSSQAQSNILLSADFTGNSLPSGWLLQGSAKFVGTVDPSTGAGGIQLAGDHNQEGAAVYAAPFTTQNINIELSAMYAPVGYCCAGNYYPNADADDVGVGFYSAGPSTNIGNRQPTSPNGYYATYEFYMPDPILDHIPALMYNGNDLMTGSAHVLARSGLNYLFTQTIVTSSSVSMNALNRTESPWITEPTIGSQNILTYNGTLDTSHSTLYVGGSDGDIWSHIYVYWLRVLTYSAAVPEYPIYLFPLVASLTVTMLALRRTRIKSHDPMR